MAYSSMVYTIGTALSHALEDDTSVEVLVDGTWLDGAVVLYDGHGVVLDSGEQHSVVRVEGITAVRIMTQSPMLQGIEGPQAVDFAEPVPMPGPRVAAAS